MSEDPNQNAKENPSLVQVLQTLLPSGVAVSGGTIEGAQHPLFPVEEPAIAKAVQVRRDEFRAGRSYARSALSQLGCDLVALPRLADRQPEWPQGFVGSITHTRQLCAAIVGPSDMFFGVGIDIEGDAPLSPQLYESIATAREIAHFATPFSGPFASLDRAKLVFAIKEAVFKANYPATRHWLGFHDAEVDIDSEHQSFRARLSMTAPIVPGHEILCGRWAAYDGHVIATIALSRQR